MKAFVMTAAEKDMYRWWVDQVRKRLTEAIEAASRCGELCPNEHREYWRRLPSALSVIELPDLEHMHASLPVSPLESGVTVAAVDPHV